MTIDRKLVCTDILEGDPIRTKCKLIGSTFKDEVIVRKQNLIVEATLTQSCNPVITWQALYMLGDYLIQLQACEKNPFPKLFPALPSGITIRLGLFVQFLRSLRMPIARAVARGVHALRRDWQVRKRGSSGMKSEIGRSRQDVQKGHPARPQPMEAPEAYRSHPPNPELWEQLLSPGGLR